MLRVNDAVKINTDAHLHPGGRLCFVKDALLLATNRYKARLYLCCFVVYFFMFRLFRASWYLLALTRFIFCDPRGNTFCVASRDHRYKARLYLCCFVAFVVYFFMFRLFRASWYLLALALCSLRDFAKLCVPEKSSFAHMYM